ncbi:hypothetical protein EV421DRAFT_1911332 [Armillaria borealis]|uniref:Uncharacterized protein n=1 Tax=Armillaria borealis TaxID=47425 RepID=A0AA39J045_9AGAR|nr:hypothetical protein EV421DRAFT_1911332 [Armillaria borealis]
MVDGIVSMGQLALTPAGIVGLVVVLSLRRSSVEYPFHLLQRLVPPDRKACSNAIVFSSTFVCSNPTARKANPAISEPLNGKSTLSLKPSGLTADPAAPRSRDSCGDIS